jgi:hypothetical protein
VYSRCLGGPGIEKMEFMIRGAGPGYQRRGEYSGNIQMN